MKWNEIFSLTARSIGFDQRKNLIDLADKKISITRQAQLLGIARSTAEGNTSKDLDLMMHIDKIYMAHPFMGSRSIMRELKKIGLEVNRKKIRRLMKQMGIRAVAPGPHTSRPHPQHIKYPYLLREIRVTRVNQVWSPDITYIPMQKGFMYLVAVMDWYSRKVLSWRVSNTMDSRFCLEELKALSKFGTPEIFNTDQGAQFTSNDFRDVLKNNGIKISMDGKGRAIDNVFVEGLWRTVKYKHIYLRPASSGHELRQGLEKYFRWYNKDRLHSSLDHRPPDAVYFAPFKVAA